MNLNKFIEGLLGVVGFMFQIFVNIVVMTYRGKSKTRCSK